MRDLQAFYKFKKPQLSACLPSSFFPLSFEPPTISRPSFLSLSVDLHQVLSDSFGRSSSLLTTHANQIPFKQISN